MIRKAFSEQLIQTHEEADIWFQMIEDRNLTSHAYDEELSERIYTNILKQYSHLLQEMAAKLQILKWE